MNDLISRQAAIDAIENAFDRETILNRFVRKIAISAVRLLPSVQPEVIRCKDCENLQTDWKPQDSDGYYCAVMDRMMEEDGFCSHAERRQDD